MGVHRLPAVTGRASREGLHCTPPVEVDGTFLDDLSQQGLVDLINAED